MCATKDSLLTETKKLSNLELVDKAHVNQIASDLKNQLSDLSKRPSIGGHIPNASIHGNINSSGNSNKTSLRNVLLRSQTIDNGNKYENLQRSVEGRQPRISKNINFDKSEKD